MAINEVFPNPTVKQVVFQIRFPNLFYIENRISELQLKIMKEFPISSLLLKKHLVFVDTITNENIENMPTGEGSKIWHFGSEKGFELNILHNSLDLTSNFHKTYNNENGEKFRDCIKYVLDIFIDIVKIPTINRIGLRYIDECPVPKKTNRSFKLYYNTSFPLERFKLEDSSGMEFKVMIKRGKYSLRYNETFQIVDNKNRLILDFDGFASDIPSTEYLSVTDELHNIISEEFQNTIKGPVYKFMRN